MNGKHHQRLISRATARSKPVELINKAFFLLTFLASGGVATELVHAQPLQPFEEQLPSPSVVDRPLFDSLGVVEQPIPTFNASSANVVSEIVSPDWTWKVLPQGFLYRTYWGSLSEPRLSTRAFRDTGGHNSLDSQIGGRFGIVRFGDPFAEEGFQLDLLGGANLRQNTQSTGWDMTGTDYRYDIPLTYRRGRHAWKFGFYHVSSHMGDEFLAHNPSVARIDYFRNSIYFGYSYYATEELRLYGEVDYAFSRDYSEPLHLQFGFDWGPTRPTGVRGAPFLAVNGQLREELNFGGSATVQAGWAWKGEGVTAGTLRTGLHYYNGGSPQFSFYQESEQQIGWGLWYDF